MLMKFPDSHNFNLNIPEHNFNLENFDTPGGRFYKTPWGFYPSVTTKLSNHYKVDLSDWKNRIGEAAANKIVDQAKNRGTALHNTCEDYFFKRQPRNIMPVNLERFYKVKTILDDNITDIYGIEYPLWSKVLETAGRTDLICKYKGRPTIVDFKTSRYHKKEEWIKSYITQTVAYAFMANSSKELGFLDYSIEDICIIIVADEEAKPQIIHKEITNYMWNDMINIMTSTKVEVPKELNVH